MQKKLTMETSMNPPNEGDLFLLYARVQKPGMTAEQVTDEIKKLHPSWFESNPYAEWAMETLLREIVPEWCQGLGPGDSFYKEYMLRKPVVIPPETSSGPLPY